MGNNSVTGLFSSIAAGAVLTLGSAGASAYTHVDAAIEFITCTAPEDNRLATAGEACEITWGDPSTCTGYSGKLRAACFVTLMIEHALDVNAGYDAYDAADFYQIWLSNSPTSGDYFALCDDSPAVGEPDPTPDKEYYLRRVTKEDQIQSGDLLFVNQTPTYSGHAMIVRSAATQMTTPLSPIYAGTKQWALPIIDVTGSRHGCQWSNLAWADSRWPATTCNGAPESAYDSGAGFGAVRSYSDLSNNPLGYSWACASGSTYNSPSSRPYRVCRLHNLPADPVPPPPPPPPPP